MEPPKRVPPFRSRRRFPRLEVLGLVEGKRIPLDVPMTVRDLSQGGFSAESSVPFPPGTHHHFRFTTIDQHEVSLDATSVHCRLASVTHDGHHTYITGFEFVSTDATDQSVAALVDTLSSVLTLD